MDGWRGEEIVEETRRTRARARADLVVPFGWFRSVKEVTDRFIWLGRWILGRCVL